LHKPTPSKYPAPPACVGEPVTGSQEYPECSEIFPEKLGKSGESIAEGEEEEKRTEEEGEEHPAACAGEGKTNVVAFPAAASEEERQLRETTRVVARILKLQETPALRRIVEEYRASPHVSLLGEADAAREWVDDRHRNRRGQRMTPAFFRRWLKRELEAVQRRELTCAASAQEARATGTAGQQEAGGVGNEPGQRRLPNLMNLEANYRRAMTGGPS
jgi:hypothetical protein